MGLSFRIPDQTAAVRLIEEAGFEAVSCGEHVAFHGPTPNAFINLAHAAGVSARLRLLSAITLVPLYPPALLAKQAAMLDVVSGGRFDFGVGVGGEYPPEFEAVGVPHSERGARTDEALEAILALWTGDPVEFEGRFTRLPGVSIDPAPIQLPHPPIWVAGRSPAAMRRAARYGDVWMPYFYTPEQVGESLEEVRRMAAERGREPEQVAAAVNCFVAVDRDGRSARRTAVESISRIYKQEFSGVRERYLVAGTPAQCVERLGEYLDAGATGAVFSLACEPDRGMETIRVVGEEVLPALRARYEATD
jgi:probable F420-dependent oxidoreductase